jgi:hypothetical protein
MRGANLELAAEGASCSGGAPAWGGRLLFGPGGKSILRVGRGVSYVPGGTRGGRPIAVLVPNGGGDGFIIQQRTLGTRAVGAQSFGRQGTSGSSTPKPALGPSRQADLNSILPLAYIITNTPLLPEPIMVNLNGSSTFYMSYLPYNMRFPTGRRQSRAWRSSNPTLAGIETLGRRGTAGGWQIHLRQGFGGQVRDKAGCQSAPPQVDQRRQVRWRKKPGYHWRGRRQWERLKSETLGGGGVSLLRAKCFTPATTATER